MNTQLQRDLDQLDHILDDAKMQSLQFLHDLPERPTSVSKFALDVEHLPEAGAGAEATLRQFNERFEKLIVGSSGPRYWGFVTGGSTPAATVGDWLATVYDQNTQAVKGQGDVSANIEFEAVRLLIDLLELPHTFLGGFVTGATMSNFSCLGVARQWLGKQLGRDIAREGVRDDLAVLSATPHSSAIKSLAMLGMGSSNIIPVNVMDDNREAIDTADLEAKIQTLNGKPFILVSSAGTVNTVDFDDFAAIAALKEKYTFWWHIDGAFGAFAACSPNYKHLLDGWAGADSITLDCHKWLNVPYESAVFLVQEKHRLLQLETFQNSNAPYLGDPLENFNYLNFLPENSRRLKALPAWFTLMAYGRQGYRDIVENSITLAQRLSVFIETHPAFELLAPTRLNNVCFTLRGDDIQAAVPGFLASLNATGQVFMTPTIYQGRKGIRAAFVNWRTTEADVDRVIALMEGLTD